jgi:hypothetical protein
VISTTPSVQSHGPDPDREERHYFFLSLAVAWPTLWYWFQELTAFRPIGGWMLVPLILFAGLILVWWFFTAKVWARPGVPRDTSVVIGAVMAGVGGVAGWFVLPILALVAVPWLGAGHSGVGAPNPVGLLAALVGSFAISWFGATRVRRLIGHGPTSGFTVASLLASLASCGTVASVHSIEQGERERLMISVGACRQDSTYFDDQDKMVSIDKCFETAERLRSGVDGPADLARIVDTLKWGCMQFESSSCTALGELFERGEGVSKSRAKADEAYAKGCANSSPTAKAACDHLTRLRAQ